MKYKQEFPTLEYIFAWYFKANVDWAKNLSNDNEDIDLQILDRICNVPLQWKQILSAKSTPEDERISRKRTFKFVQKVAYWFKYELKKEISYEHILIKFAIANGENIPYKQVIPGYISQIANSLSSYIVPLDWDINDDLLIL